MAIAVLAKIVLILVFNEALNEAAVGSGHETLVELAVSHLSPTSESKGAVDCKVTSQMSFAAASWNSLTSSPSKMDDANNCLLKRCMHGQVHWGNLLLESSG